MVGADTAGAVVTGTRREDGGAVSGRGSLCPAKRTPDGVGPPVAQSVGLGHAKGGFERLPDAPVFPEFVA